MSFGIFVWYIIRYFGIFKVKAPISLSLFQMAILSNNYWLFQLTSQVIKISAKTLQGPEFDIVFNHYFYLFIHAFNAFSITFIVISLLKLQTSTK